METDEFLWPIIILIVVAIVGILFYLDFYVKSYNHTIKAIIEGIENANEMIMKHSEMNLKIAKKLADLDSRLKKLEGKNE